MGKSLKPGGRPPETIRQRTRESKADACRCFPNELASWKRSLPIRQPCLGEKKVLKEAAEKIPLEGRADFYALTGRGGVVFKEGPSIRGEAEGKKGGIDPERRKPGFEPWTSHEIQRRTEKKFPGEGERPPAKVKRAGKGKPPGCPKARDPTRRKESKKIRGSSIS